MLQGKYELPPSEHPCSPLAKHEIGLFEELRLFLKDDKGRRLDHRSEMFSQHVTPRAVELITSIGHRFAYDIAKSTGSVRQELIDVWEADCMLENAAWYIENMGITASQMREKHVTSIRRMRPLLPEILAEFDMERHCSSTPLISKRHWDDLMASLPSFGSCE